MSKRDRAARAKGGNDSGDSSADKLEVGADDAITGEDSQDPVELAETDSSMAAEVRPTGKRSSRGRRATGALTTGDDTTTPDSGSVAVKERKKKAPAAEIRNPFIRIWVFLQQVVSEMKKVIWPTRREMITYTIAVLVFVVVMTAFISGIDLAFAKAVLWLFS